MTVVLITLTVLSLAAAAVATLLAWQSVSDNRRRSDARVARLAEVLHELEPRESEAVAGPHLLGRSDEPRPTRFVPLAVAAAGLLVLAGVVALPRAEQARTAQAAKVSDTKEPVARPGPAAVDLLALTHERGTSGQLELRGEVRGPSNGAMMEHITAVALLFDRQGAYLSSSRAPLETRTTNAGGSASFFISVPDAERVGRYRVSFREGDRVVPHVDRRRGTEGTEAGS